MFISTYELSSRYTPVVAIIHGEHIRRLREAAGFATQRAMAEAAGMDPSKVSKLEADKEVNLRMETLKRLAATLGVPVRTLFDEPNVIYDPDAKTRGLNPEDLTVARLFHDAATSVRVYISTVLRNGADEKSAELIARALRLPKEAREEAERVIASLEEIQNPENVGRATTDRK